MGSVTNVVVGTLLKTTKKVSEMSNVTVDNLSNDAGDPSITTSCGLRTYRRFARLALSPFIVTYAFVFAPT